MDAASAFALLGKIVAAGPSIINAVTDFWPRVQNLIGVASGTITGQAAQDAIAALEADIDAHIAHIDAEGAKLGQ